MRVFDGDLQRPLIKSNYCILGGLAHSHCRWSDCECECHVYPPTGGGARITTAIVDEVREIPADAKRTDETLGSLHRTIFEWSAKEGEN